MERAFCAADPAVAHVFVDVVADDVEVRGGDAHHLVRARRLGVGERVTAADDAGHWRPYVVRAADAARLALTAVDEPRAEPRLAPELVAAPALRKGGLDHVVAHVTELGVSGIVPVVTERSVIAWDAERTDRVLARLRRVTREAAMRSRRARLPRLHPPCRLADVVARAGSGLVVADRTGMPAGAVPEPPAGVWTLLSGPEGGFTEAEADLLGGAATLAVGPHVLRADTACVAAVSALVGRCRDDRAREA